MSNIVPNLRRDKMSDCRMAINKTMHDFSPEISDLWRDEKIAATESIVIAKEEALTYLAMEREKVMRLSHEEALKELINARKIESKIKIINSISDNGLFKIN